MKQQEINSRIQQTLHEFESLEIIQPSSDFNQLLMNKLASKSITPEKSYETAKSAVALFFIIIINIGIILSFITKDNGQSLLRGNELRAVSKEFLINPTSISE